MRKEHSTTVFSRRYNSIRRGTGVVYLIKRHMGFLQRSAGVLIFWGLISIILMNLMPHVHPSQYWLLQSIALNLALTPFMFEAVSELYKAIFLPGGDLHGWDRAGLPVIACVGGIIFPMGLFLGLNWALGADLGWKAAVIVTATDIALAVAIADAFGLSKPARNYLLAIAIVDDLVGIVLIAVLFGHGSHWWGFLIAAAAFVVAYAMYRLPRRWIHGHAVPITPNSSHKMRRIQISAIRNWERFASVFLLIPERLRWKPITSWYWYIVPGAMFWVGFYFAGAHPVVAPAFLVFFVAHAERDKGWFIEIEEHRLADTLSQLEHALKPIMPWSLGFFAFMIMGVEVTGLTTATFVVLLSLVFGKILGVTIHSFVAMRYFGFRLPVGMSEFDVFRVAVLTGNGFTVALLIAGLYAHGQVALEGGLKLGAALTLVGSTAIYLASERLYSIYAARVTKNELTYDYSD